MPPRHVQPDSRLATWLLAVWLVGAGLAGAGMRAQQVSSPARGPAAVRAQADHGTTGEIPLDEPAAQQPFDRSDVESPVGRVRSGPFVPAGARVQVRLQSRASSAEDHNGQMLPGVLLTPVTLSSGRQLPAGTPVKTTVISSVAAGQMKSYGILTLQLASVNGIGLISDVLSFQGQDGHKDLADAAPEKGTEALVAPDTVLTFRVMGPGDTPDPRHRPGGVGGTSAGRSPAGINPSTPSGSAPSATGQPSNTVATRPGEGTSHAAGTPSAPVTPR